MKKKKKKKKKVLKSIEKLNNKISGKKLKINGVNNKVLSQVGGENCGYVNSLEIQKTDRGINLLVP